MLFGSQPGVDSRIASLRPFPEESDLPWPSTYHSYRPHLGLPQTVQGLEPDPCHAFVPDATLHCIAFMVPGNDHTSIVPEDWNGWLPPHPDELPPEPEPPQTKKRKESRKKRSNQPKISEEVSKRLQSQLQSATRGVSLRKIFSKHDTDRSGTLTATELKKLIRKELRITTALVSDREVEDLAAALDGDRTGNISIEELLSFIERGSSTFFSSSSGPGKESSQLQEDPRDQEVPKSRDSSQGDDDDTDASEKKGPSGTSQQPSSAILASMREPYSRFVYRPLAPPVGDTMITLNTPSPRDVRARKASLQSRPKEPVSPRAPKKKSLETKGSEGKELEKAVPTEQGGGSAYWLRGLARARPSPIPPVSARGARQRASRNQAYGRTLPSVALPSGETSKKPSMAKKAEKSAS